jgi:TRAP-type transport system periplasmic protein
MARYRFHVLFAAMALALAPFFAGHAHAHGVTLKVYHGLPAQSLFQTQFLVPWTKKIEEESGHRIRFLIHPETHASLYDQVKDGSADIAWTSVEDTRERFPAFGVFELPRIANRARGSSLALWEYVQANNLARTEFGDVRLLAVHQQDKPQFHMLAKPVQSLADLKGLKLHTGSRVTHQLLTALGATPVNVPAPQLAEALVKGAVDGVVAPWASLAPDAPMKFHSEVDGKSPWPPSPLFVFAMNPGAYKSLPDDLKKVLNANSGAETSAWLGKIFDEGAVATRKLAAERGDKMNALAADEIEKWQGSAQSVVDERIKELDKRGLSGKELLDSAKALVAQHDSAK